MTHVEPQTGRLKDLVADAMSGSDEQAARRWAASGAMWLTGPHGGDPSIEPARVALAADALAAFVADMTAELGRCVEVDGAQLLGERAAGGGLERRGAVSCGEATQLLASADGSIGLSLARVEDISVLDAWLGQRLHAEEVLPFGDWSKVQSAVASIESSALVSSAAELGIPCASLAETTLRTPLVRRSSVPTARSRWGRLEELRVVDLSALWAGPLCAHLLGEAGAQIIKVESSTRTDGARSGPSSFYDLLHGGHQSVQLDFASADQRTWLRRLIKSADIVIEASRPRALRALDASFEHIRSQDWNGLWLSITAHGRGDKVSNRVGFGDDSAVAGGLVAHDDDDSPIFCVDAIADPLTGMVGAAALLEAIHDGASGLVEVTLAGTAAHVSDGLRSNPAVLAGGHPVQRPVARIPVSSAPLSGEHTDLVLGSL